jgi:hypothetical protein
VREMVVLVHLPHSFIALCLSNQKHARAPTTGSSPGPSA